MDALITPNAGIQKNWTKPADSALFILKPSTTGYVVLGKEAAYNKTLNLKVNESGNYTLNLKNPGIIKSIQASGNVIGNGTVKIYIQKDGKKYLIFDNKRLNNADAAS